MRIEIRWLVVVVAAASIAGCGDIRFELSPYAIRDLDLVYSDQEEITFFVWRIGIDADPDKVRFELLSDGRYRALDLGQTLFPAAPYACDGGRAYCYQFQLRGRYAVPKQPPLRSVHEDEGVFAGPTAAARIVALTFDIEPVGLGHNEAIAPLRVDWFAEHHVPFKRAYEWQLVTQPDDCAPTAPEAWRAMGASVSVDYGWVERPHCFAARPDASDHRGAEVVVPIVPAAETTYEVQPYVPARIDSPIVYGILVDLHIPDPTRCAAVKDVVLGTIEETIEDEGSPTKLGTYTPIDEAGDAYDGCTQAGDRHYPITPMVEESLAEIDLYGPDNVRLLWIYLNNINLPPTLTLLAELAIALETIRDRGYVHTWGVVADLLTDVANWDDTTGWRPIEDELFVEDLEHMAKGLFPFSTMDHRAMTPVFIDPLAAADDPLYLKLCQTAPVPYSAIGAVLGVPIYDQSDYHVPWPALPDRPYYLIPLGVQFLVRDVDYVDFEVSAGVEVCERFCDHPFRSVRGGVFSSWLYTPGPLPMERCHR